MSVLIIGLENLVLHHLYQIWDDKVRIEEETMPKRLGPLAGSVRDFSYHFHLFGELECLRRDAGDSYFDKLSSQHIILVFHKIDYPVNAVK